MTVNWADVLLATGAVGLVSGLGGKYFFVVPVISHTTVTPGVTPAPGTDSWGLPEGPAFTLQSGTGTTIPGGPTSLGQALAVGLSFEFCLPLSTFGLSEWPGWGYQSAGANTATASPFTYQPSGYTSPLFVAGPLGQYAGYLFLAALLGGVALRKGWIK